MKKVTYSMGASLDGFMQDADGNFAWGGHDDDIFRADTDYVRSLSGWVLGRRLYEAMIFWEEGQNDFSHSASFTEFANLWRALPKVVFSSSLTEVVGRNTRLATRSLTEEIDRLRAGARPGDIAIGGADLAASAAELGLIDEYRVKVYPVLVGGGVPLFPQSGRNVDLNLIDAQAFTSQVVIARYRTAR